ncbi:MAG: hypothetical protein ACP5O2_02125 [Bacteroidales bacterium]
MIGFYESRSVRESWMGWLVLAGGLFSLVSGLLATLTQAKQAVAAGRLVEDVMVPIVLLVVVAVFCIYLLVSMQLEVAITEKGISYRFLPFIKQRNINWDEITYAWVRKYRAIGEYGGWGYRGMGRKHRAFTMGEKYGIQLITKDGKDILLGTRRAEAAEKALRWAGKGEAPQKQCSPRIFLGLGK